MLPISTEEDNDFEATKHAIPRRLLLKQSISFFMFGLINNVLYVIILSAALDLVPPSTPKGIIAFCNIFPALIAKLAWPYLLKGKIRYARRIASCCGLSVLGMIVSTIIFDIGLDTDQCLLMLR
jgi:battenin